MYPSSYQCFTCHSVWKTLTFHYPAIEDSMRKLKIDASMKVNSINVVCYSFKLFGNEIPHFLASLIFFFWFCPANSGASILICFWQTRFWYVCLLFCLVWGTRCKPIWFNILHLLRRCNEQHQRNWGGSRAFDGWPGHALLRLLLSRYVFFKTFLVCLDFFDMCILPFIS